MFSIPIYYIFFQGNTDINRIRHHGPGSINTFPRRMPDPSYPSNHLPPHLHLSPNASNQRPRTPSNIQNQSPYNSKQENNPVIPQQSRNICLGPDNNIQMQDISSNFHRNSFKQKFETNNFTASQQSSNITPQRSGNLKTSLENLVSSDQQQRMPGQGVQPPRKTVTFKGDVQTMECSPEEQQERRCWRHQSSGVSYFK